MKIVTVIMNIINRLWSFISFLYKYRTVYKISGLFLTRKFKRTENLHKYAVLVAARNEEAVIGKLIESIKQQDYPQNLIEIFVVADNCTDNTAEIVREYGAVCYERYDTEHRTKGFALQYLVECIRKDYSIEAFEGYFIFDADNLLKSDYISRMNEAFDSGEKIITSYRNTKNFDNNWISASYALHWLRTIRNEHRARSVFRLATRIQGTGFLFANELIKNGWNYTGLTEDRAFCADAVANGYQISYNNEAEFYDEQPTDLKIALRQRIRWAKGHLQAVAETGPTLFAHIFYTGTATDKSPKDVSRFKRLLNNVKFRFMSFDMLTVVIPRSFLSALKRWLIFLLRVIVIIGTGKVFGAEYAPDFLEKILQFFGINIGFLNDLSAVLWLFVFTIGWVLSSYFNAIITALYIFIVEHKRIMYMRWYKKLWYCITFPLFDIIGKISMFIALFTKVEWKPIPHNAAIGINELPKNKNSN